MIDVQRLSTIRVLATFVFLASLLLYLPSVRNGFAYDDHVIIRLDNRIHDLTMIGQIFTQSYWRDPDLGLYRPLTSLSFAIDWAISGGDPRWFHFVNTVWNALAGTLVFLFLATLVPVSAAVPGALVFTAHPVHVEAVANVVGRAELMAGVFSIAALLIWSRNSSRHGLRMGSTAAVTVLYLLAMLAKESAIMLPGIIALCDIARRALTPRGVWSWLRLHSRPLAILGATALLYVVARTAVTGGLGPSSVDPTFDVADTTTSRVLTALQAWPFILRLLIAPTVLLSDYGPRIIMPAFSMTAPTVAGTLILCGLIAGGLFAWTREYGRPAAVLLFLPVALLPTSNLLVPIGVIVAERTLYLPSLAVAMAVAFIFDALRGRRASQRILTVAAAATIVLFSSRTLTRIPAWRSTDSVFEALRRDRPDSFRAQWHHARVAVNDSMPRLALQRYARMLEIWPYRKKAVLEAAAYAGQVGDLHFTHNVTAFAVQRWPHDLAFLRMRAGVQLDLGDTTGAYNTVRQGLLLEPDDPTLTAMLKAIVDDGQQ